MASRLYEILRKDVFPDIETGSWCHLEINTLRPRLNGRQFPGDIFKWIFLNENVLISIKTSLKFVRKGKINNIPALVQIMAWRRPGDKPLSEPRAELYWRIYASLGLNELTSAMYPAAQHYEIWKMWGSQGMYNRACHPGSYYWDYRPGALPLIQVTTTHFKIGHR